MSRRIAIIGVAVALLPCACNEDDAARLDPVSACESHDACVEADPRYDRCQWVCEGHVTYCQVSCEVDADCEGRGLPASHRYCSVPRPGQGFCNPYDFNYGDDACRQTVPAIPDDP